MTVTLTMTPQLIAHSVATYAKSFKGFPERSTEKTVQTETYSDKTKYHGSKLFI